MIARIVLASTSMLALRGSESCNYIFRLGLGAESKALRVTPHTLRDTLTWTHGADFAPRLSYDLVRERHSSAA
jgi:hypothetical protein